MKNKILTIIFTLGFALPIFGLNADFNLHGGTAEFGFVNHSNPNVYSENTYTDGNVFGLNLNLVSKSGLGIGFEGNYIKATSQVTKDSPQGHMPIVDIPNLSTVSVGAHLLYFFNYQKPLAPYLGAGLLSMISPDEEYKQINFGSSVKGGLIFRVTDDFGLFFEGSLINFFEKPHQDLTHGFGNKADLKTMSFGFKFNT